MRLTATRTATRKGPADKLEGRRGQGDNLAFLLTTPKLHPALAEPVKWAAEV